MVKGWIECSITDVLKPNGIKIGPFGSQLKKEMLINDGSYKVYGQENVYQNDFSVGNRFMTKNHFDSLRSCEILSGDFLMSSMGTIGECAIVPENIQQGIMDSHLIRLRLDERKIYPQYLLQLYSKQFSYLSNQTQSLSVGGIMDGLSAGIVSKLKVRFPEEIQEQKRIVNVLSDIDTLIANLELQIEKDKNLKQACLAHLFSRAGQTEPDVRLPGFSESWHDFKLEELCITITDGSHESPNEVSDGIYMPSVKDMTASGFDFSSCKKISRNDYERLVANGCKPCAGDVLIAKDGSVLKYAFSVKEDLEIVILSSIAIFRPKSNIINSDFLSYYFVREKFRESVMKENVTGTGVPRIILKNFKNILVRISKNVDEQKQIASILSAIDERINANEKKVAKYRSLKQGMMEQLLTGKIRL